MQALAAISSGVFSPDDRNRFAGLVDGIYNHDWFMVAADFDAYAKAQREVTDMTNELLRKNAEKLRMVTVETQKESERGIVDIETLKHTNETLISTLDDVAAIQRDGHEKRAAAEQELRRMETELKNKLLSLR